MPTVPDLPTLRAALAALDDPALEALCLDYFPAVYEKFGRGQRRDEKQNLLLDYVRTRPAAAARLAGLLTVTPPFSPDHLRLQQLAEHAGDGESETLPGLEGRGVSIGRDVQGSIIITGDGNIVNVGSSRSQAGAAPLSPSTLSSHPSTNPFCDRGRINDPTRFFDRTRILRDMRQMLVAGNSVSLVGEPQIGKSSVLYHLYLTRAAWLPQAAVSYLDLQGVLDVADFCAEVLEGMGQAPGDLRALKQALRRERLVLLLDEVEKLARPAFGPDLHDLLRALAQEPTLTLAVASHRPLVEVFPPSSDTSPFHNIFTEKRLEPFTLAEARDFLARRLQGTGVTFTAEEIDRLVMQSGGHPARLQQLAYALFEEKIA